MRRIAAREPLIKYDFVIPAKAGIQDVQVVTGSPPSRGRLDQSFTRPSQQRVHQRGQALLVLLMILGIGFGAWFYTFAGPSGSTVERDKITAAALAQAKEALIGRSASDSNRPGSLPCPDTNDDGVAEIFAGTVCPSNIGRLPWKTLDLPDLRDAIGERLWYVLSANFRDNAAAEPINSDTKGNITVYVGNSSTVQTNEAVAVIFSPGAAIGNQMRDAVGKNIEANYLDLEPVSGINNASATGPYIASAAQPTVPPLFNDRLLVITTADLMPVVERRVGLELRTILQNYKTATAALGYNSGAGVYPWADCSDGVSDVTPSPSAVVDGSNRGRIPWQTAVPVNWGSGGVLPLPAWFLNNKWSWVIYYSAGKNYLEGGGARCSSCVTPTLSVDGASKEVAILTTGPAGASRPGGGDIVGPWGQVNWAPGNCNPVGPTWQAWQAYLEDSQNYDLSNDLYNTPSSTAYARDRIFTIP